MNGSKDTQIAETVLDIVRAANLLERLGGEYARQADLRSVQQYMILSMLAKKSDLSMCDLRKNTLVTKQAMTGIVNRLKHGGYLDTYKDMSDQRLTRVCLTDKGKQALDIIKPFRIDGNKQAFSVLNDQELTQLSSILEKLVDNLKIE